MFGHGSVPRILEQIGWIWLAWIFWLACALALLLLLNCALRLVHLPVLPEYIQVFIALAAMITMTAFGTMEANNIKVRTLLIDSPRVPESVGDYTIAMISDMHIGNAATEYRVKRAIELVTQAKPHLILSAGDMLDGHGERERNLMSLVAGMSGQETCQKLAVFGNHDVYSSIEFSRECHSLAGFRVLEDEGVAVNDWLWIYGEKDPAQHRNDKEPSAAITSEDNWPLELHEGYPVFRILLKHRPEGFSRVFGEKAPFELELSGHSHGGQIIPFNYLVRLQHPYKEGILHTLANGMTLYVSRGTGLWGMPFRVGAPPEVTLITLRHCDPEPEN